MGLEMSGGDRVDGWMDGCGSTVDLLPEVRVF